MYVLCCREQMCDHLSTCVVARIHAEMVSVNVNIKKRNASMEMKWVQAAKRSGIDAMSRRIVFRI